MPKPYGQRGRPHDVTTNEHRFRHLHGTATAAFGHREGPRNRQPMVDRAWNRDLAAGGGSGQTISAYDPRAMRIQCPNSHSQHWSYSSAYGVRNSIARPPGVAPPHDGYTPGSNHRLLRNQFVRDQINIKWRGHQ
ncbi:hypothetical protein KC343_g1970 [Hortaea werneckii]|nr:hypothetical protein KC352_g11401 [Hortaea werneckii]KAI7570574.1 hypothetical protein KC317_g2340 [Hortaea werneckii]KAI7605013.1 hypothetical protein KC346_g11214 [Hortaea werneckii]KAI7635217.1 hypothetical protein KC343_g1970 [Hortaea werneckii]KAI7651020.1 hypothetical protein KC319_g10951 [Hortaea werneckii]